MNASRWMTIAKQELGANVAEYPGKENHNPRIMAYLHTTGSWWTTDETAWCSAFVNWVMKKAAFAGTDSARAASWAHYGTGLSVPCYGCIVVLTPGKDQATSGHVGFCTGWDKQGIYILGGNQGDAISVKRFPWARERSDGYRWPMIISRNMTA